MAQKEYTYVIVGAGLAGVSAIDGIREKDGEGAILLIGDEPHMPYDRPPLSKKLWLGKKKLEDIYLRDSDYYRSKGADLLTGRRVTGLDAGKKTVTTDDGKSHGYGKLLLATGGAPRRLAVPGSEGAGISYFRTLDDYLAVKEKAAAGASALVIGGGFIGSEMAAALAVNGVKVTMVFPESSIAERVFPADLGRAVTKTFVERGVTVLSGDLPVSFEKRGGKAVAKTKGGKEVAADIVIAGIGISPSDELAKGAGLAADNGITVDEHLASSNPDIFAAGDNANFHSPALGRRVRVEHWDTAIAMGKQAGRNMAGANEKFDYIPSFFSDLFDFGYEAAGELDSRLETEAYWKKEFDTGIIYYLKEGTVRGVMLCNVWDKVEEARALIRRGVRMDPGALKEAIAF